MNIQIFKIAALLVVSMMTFNACTTTPPQPARISYQPTKIRATGHGTVRPDAGYTVAQMKLMAERAARVDAYRNLTEQVYGLKLSNGTSVSAMVVQSDTIRTFVTGHIKGARTVSSVVQDDGFTYETVLELKLDDDFYQYCDDAKRADLTPCDRDSGAGCNLQDRYFYMSQ